MKTQRVESGLRQLVAGLVTTGFVAGAAGAGASAGVGAGAQPAGVRDTADRLGDQVIHNPFGALNLNAGVTAVKSATDEARARGLLGKRKEASKPAAPPTPPSPPPPAAPRLPFTAVGAISGAEVTGGQPIAFVKQQDQLFVVRAGDAIGQSYRVESITPQRIEFMYLPLMQRQTLALGP